MDPAQPPILTLDLLSDLWDRLTRLGAPVVDAAAAGLSQARIEELVAAEGLTLPEEAATWWRWHNGTSEGVCYYDGFPGRSICPGHELIPLEEALDVRRLKRRVAEAAASRDMDAEDGYRTAWLPLIRYSGSAIVCDCASAGPAAPLHRVSFGNVDFETAKVPVSPSIGQMVVLWIGAMDAGLWRYNPQADMIERDWDAMPQAWRDSGFM